MQLKEELGDTLELEAGTEIKFADYLLYHEDGIYYSPDGAVLDAETDDIVVSVQNILYDTWTYQDEEGHYLETGEYHVIVQWGICGGGFNQFFGTSNLYISVVSDTIANPDVAIVLNNTSYDFNWSSTSSYGYTEIAIRGTSVSYGGIESDYLDNIYWESYSNTGQYTCINETWCSGNTTIPTTLSEGAHWFSFRLTNGQSGTFAIIIHQPRFTLGGTTYAITDGYTYFINDGDSIKMNAAGGYVLFKDVSSGICNEEAADCYANVGYVYDNEDTGIHSYGYHEYNVWANYQLYVAVDYGTGYMNFNLNFNIMIINDDSIAESISPGSVSSGKFKIAINSGTVLNSKYSSASTVKYFVGKSSNYSSSSEIAAGMTKYGVSTTLSALKSGNIYSSLGLTGNVKLYVQIDSKYFVSGTITINSNGGGTVTLSQVGEENEIVEELATPVVLTSDILTSENLTNNKTNILFVFAMIIVSMLLAIEVIAIKKSKKTTKKSI